MRKHWLLFLVLACAAPPAMAVTVDDLYTATVAVSDEGDAARADALQRALGEVMVRVSGDPQITEFSRAAGILNQARSLLQQYRYQSAEKSALRLRAVFEGPAVESAMLDAGLPVWGQSRPLTMVWLLVDGKLVTRAGPSALVDAMQQIAQHRGVPLRFPSADAAASGRVAPADIRTANIARLMTVSSRYGTNHLLLGEIGSGAATWQLIEAGTTLASWRDRGEQASALAAAGITHAADVYARRYAVVGTQSGTVMVAVEGIDGGDGYTRVREFLRKLTAVQAVIPVVVDDEAVVFRVLGPGRGQALDHRISVVGWLHQDRLARELARLYAGDAPSLGYRIDLNGPR